MKNILILIILTISLSISGQNREEIILLMNEYGANHEKSNYDIEFVDAKLNPAILKIENLICEAIDEELFDQFLEMILKTKDSADETPSEVLGGIFICQAAFVEKRLAEKYKDKFLINMLEFGFRNRTYNKKEEIQDFAELEKILKRIIE